MQIPHFFFSQIHSSIAVPLIELPGHASDSLPYKSLPLRYLSPTGVGAICVDTSALPHFKSVCSHVLYRHSAPNFCPPAKRHTNPHRL
jgi:hypothetical protein